MIIFLRDKKGKTVAEVEITRQTGEITGPVRSESYDLRERERSRTGVIADIVKDLHVSINILEYSRLL